ncbi:MAG: hypothetical protein O2820_15580 [Planctomycetota bacterium]|nr:hypothetical protein [Planctomycetota bacterium]MDA1250637.1 hypothetical protein [Planctomycetota bacterium]
MSVDSASSDFTSVDSASVDLVTPWAVEHACMQHDSLVEKTQKLRGDLKRSLAGQPSRRTRERVGTLLNQLVDELLDLLRIKRDSGYFGGMTLGLARLQSEVDQLDRDWEHLVSNITSLAEQLKRNQTSRSTPSRVQNCFRTIDELDLRESRLVQELWSFEIG